MDGGQTFFYLATCHMYLVMCHVYLIALYIFFPYNDCISLKLHNKKCFRFWESLQLKEGDVPCHWTDLHIITFLLEKKAATLRQPSLLTPPLTKLCVEHIWRCNPISFAWHKYWMGTLDEMNTFWSWHITWGSAVLCLLLTFQSSVKVSFTVISQLFCLFLSWQWSTDLKLN